MNNDMLANIEYLREKADVSYAEAAELLERNDGNVMRVLVELERQGRVYAQASPRERDAQTENPQQACQEEVRTAKDNITSFINRAFENHLVVEKKRDDGEKNLVANVPVPFAIGVAIAAPWLTVGTAVVAIATGHNVRIAKEKQDD